MSGAGSGACEPIKADWGFRMGGLRSSYNKGFQRDGEYSYVRLSKILWFRFK